MLPHSVLIWPCQQSLTVIDIFQRHVVMDETSPTLSPFLFPFSFPLFFSLSHTPKPFPSSCCDCLFGLSVPSILLLDCSSVPSTRYCRPLPPTPQPLRPPTHRPPLSPSFQIPAAPPTRLATPNGFLHFTMAKPRSPHKRAPPPPDHHSPPARSIQRSQIDQTPQHSKRHQEVSAGETTTRSSPLPTKIAHKQGHQRASATASSVLQGAPAKRIDAGFSAKRPPFRQFEPKGATGDYG